MSDFILKFWPVQDVSEDKSELIRNSLKSRGLIGDDVEHWNGVSYQVTKKIRNYLNYDFEDEGTYSELLVIKISENDYGVKEGEDDIETFDRRNVVSIYEGDGSIVDWSKLNDLLSDITGDEYEGGWEIL